MSSKISVSGWSAFFSFVAQSMEADLLTVPISMKVCTFSSKPHERQQLMILTLTRFFYKVYDDLFEELSI